MATAAFYAILVLGMRNNLKTPLKRALGSAQSDFEKFGQSSQQIGKTMALAGGALLAPIVATTKASIDFEDHWTGVVKTVEASTGELAGMRRELLAMSDDIPTAANDLADIASAAGQLGIQTPRIVGFTRVMADLNETTNLGAEAAPQFAKFANITRMAQGDFDRLGSTVVHLGNNMATTEADIVAFGMRIAGAASQVGISQPKIMGFGAALSSVGLEAEAGGTAISKVFIDLANRTKTGGAELDKVAKIAKMTGADFKAAFEKDAASATVSFIEGLGKVKEEGGNVFAVLDSLGMGEVRLRDSLLRASGAGDLLRKSLSLSTTAWDENTALAKEAGTRYGTTGSKLKILKNNVVNLAIQVGEVMVPALQATVDTLKPILKAVKDWTAEHPKATLAIVASVAALGGFLVVAGGAVYMVGTLANAVSGVSKVISVLSNTTRIMSAVQWAWNAAMAANPIGLVVAGVVAMIAAVTAMVVYWDDLKSRFMEAPGWMKAVVVVAGTFVWPFVALAGAIRFVIDNWDDLPGAIGRGVSRVAKYLFSLVPKVAGVAGRIVGFMMTLPIQIPRLLFMAVRAGGSAIMSAAPAVWAAAKSVASSVWDYFKALPVRMYEAGKNIINSIVEGMKSVAMAPVNFISGVVQDVRDFLPFSPAKRGALRDIHRVKIVETIADTIKPAPMVKAMQGATGALMGSVNVEGGQVARPVMAGGGSANVVLNFSPTVNVQGGAAGGSADDVRAVLMAMLPQMSAEVRRLLASGARGSHSAG